MAARWVKEPDTPGQATFCTVGSSCGAVAAKVRKALPLFIIWCWRSRLTAMMELYSSRAAPAKIRAG